MIFLNEITLRIRVHWLKIKHLDGSSALIQTNARKNNTSLKPTSVYDKYIWVCPIHSNGPPSKAEKCQKIQKNYPNISKDIQDPPGPGPRGPWLGPGRLPLGILYLLCISCIFFISLDIFGYFFDCFGPPSNFDFLFCF